MLKRCLGCISLTVFVFGAGLPMQAELSAYPQSPMVDTIILSLIEDADPIFGWMPIRPHVFASPLNTSGEARLDGRADWYIRENSYPVVVWAYNNGTEHDIALSQWDGAAWTATEFLTTSAADQLDPRVFVEPDGTTHVVWWEQDTISRVMLATKPASGSLWNTPQQVTAPTEAGRRPAIAVENGTVWVAYERDSAVAGMAQDVVASKLANGLFAPVVVNSTARTESLDVMLHVQNGTMWADWKHAEGSFGCSLNLGDSSWSVEPLEAWSDPSWVGVEQTRKDIQRAVGAGG